MTFFERTGRRSWGGRIVKLKVLDFNDKYNNLAK